VPDQTALVKMLWAMWMKAIKERDAWKAAALSQDRPSFGFLNVKLTRQPPGPRTRGEMLKPFVGVWQPGLARPIAAECEDEDA